MRRLGALLTAAVLLTAGFPAGARADGTAYAYLSAAATAVTYEKFSVTVTLNLYGGATVNGVDATLDYDSRTFTAGTVTANTALTGALTAASSGTVRFQWGGTTAATAASFTLFTVNFTVSGGAAEGEHLLYPSCGELYTVDTSNGYETVDIPYETDGSVSVWVGERLEIVPSGLTLIVGQSTELFANKDVNEWYSTQPDIVSVDAAGNVTAHAVGAAVIVAAGGLNGQETATVTVQAVARSVFFLSVKTPPVKTAYLVGETVDLAGLTLTVMYDNGDRETVGGGFTAAYDFSSAGTKTVTVTWGEFRTTFTVTVTAPPLQTPTGITSGTFTVGGGYLSRIAAGTGVETLLGGLNERVYVELYRKNGAQVTSGIVVTGMTARLVANGTVKQTLMVVVTGDANGDGAVSVTDMLAVKAQILKKSSLTGAYALAADTSGDGDITVTDFLQIKAQILKKSSVTPR